MALWWAIMLGLLFALDDYYLAVALVGTPTLAMLWPVGRTLGRRYLTYRPLAWVLGIVTMWMIPATGFVLHETDWSFNLKSAVFFTLPPVIAFGGILVALPWAHSRPPLRMFFRPDLLFGDGRTLVGGTLMMVLGMRYLFAGHPPGDLWALPAWNWYSLAFGIALGIIPIVLMRGMLKLVQRLLRLRDGLFAGYPSIAFREWMLLFFALNFGFAFHHLFIGRVVFDTIGEPGAYDLTWRFWTGLGVMGAAAWWMVLVKGSCKRAIGEPFFFETWPETLFKQTLFVIGWGAFFYAFMMFLNSRMFGAFHGWDAQGFTGLGFFLSGILILTVGRTIAQHYQRQAMLAHFAGVILPTQVDRGRERLMSRILEGMAGLPRRVQTRVWLSLHHTWGQIDPEDGSLMAWTQVNGLAEMPAGARQELLAAQREALDHLGGLARERAVSNLIKATAKMDSEKGVSAQREILTALT